MKKIIIGTVLCFVGTMLFFAATLAANSVVARVSSWRGDIGMFWSAASDGGLVPLFVVSSLLIASGIVVMVLNILKKSD